MSTNPFIWLQHILPQHLLSRGTGSLASSESPWLKNLLIRRFIAAYDVQMDEALRPASEYRSFNDFFTRALKPGARPLADASTSILCPADGAVSQLGKIEDGRIVQAKGQSYTAAELLGGDEALAAKFEGGSFITIYLSPSDYHRVHTPVAGSLVRTDYIPGDLFSVNTATAADVPRLFSRNERLSSIFDTPVGQVANVMVGAMIVASIETVWSGLVQPHGKRVINSRFKRGEHDFAAGDEMGRFLLGSTAILLFEPGKVQWREDLKPLDTVRMGESIARKT
ncbi:archaetidylserine decarboxylase [Altererythrobacter sp. ZODW24]|uniref:archaetidylserine decarboxylase n=1 Tax=Altererythrobacter sp. ZODW24 TaxID=2185142 RepID=UPI000DF7A060|nr:archaetidylserine decarboxylase [Altererythrobacter sp. ZODW24]